MAYMPGNTFGQNIAVRGIYGGVPTALLERGGTLGDHGINAVWMGSGALTQDAVRLLRGQGAFVYAEFNSMHHAAFLADHPDAAPIGSDGAICPPPDGWQGVCPTHQGYRRDRMAAFRAALADFAIDGIWLDYHHSHASWEQANPNLPDTCFCARCLALFCEQAGDSSAVGLSTPEAAARLLGPLREQWTAWRCSVFTEWVREYRQIRDEVRPAALLGTFHCPWTDTERDGALTHKLAIDLRAQREHIDVFSAMPYHARFGHADDVDWIARQVAWLGRFLAITGKETGATLARGEKRIWPIIQLSDWGTVVPPEQVPAVLEVGTRPPATGITVFNWNSLRGQGSKVAALTDFYRNIAGASSAH
jgi:hypothetical protein